MLDPVLRNVFLFTALVAMPAGGHASEIHPSHEVVRTAVERGDILALEVVLSRVREKLPGQITRTEIEIKKGRWLYEFRIVDATGRISKAYVDAKTAEVVSIKGK